MLPTAMHAVADVHETPVRKLFGTPAGAGIVWTLQLVPFHRSAMTCAALLLPTAVHADGEVQETAFKNDPGLPEVGVGSMLQLVPSQCSVSVPSELPELSRAVPTATQAVGDVHETPFSAPAAAPPGFGVGTIRHAVPSQSSARLPLGLPKGKSVVPPTAMQLEDDLHDTPTSCAPCVPCGLTVGWTLHWVPSHPWPTVTIAPEASTPYPTAIQAEAPGQATPISRPLLSAFEVACRLQLWPSQRSARVEGPFAPAKLAPPTAVHAEDDEHEMPFRAANCDPVGFGVDWTVHFVPFHCSVSVTPTPELFV
jgi:hypothetical protein